MGENEDTGAAAGGVEVMEVIEVMDSLCSGAALPDGVFSIAFLACLSFSRNLKLTP
jgi:hypothetical protein